MSYEQIKRCAEFAQRNGGTGPLSTGESLAACLVLNRHDWLKELSYTELEAMRRVESGGWSLADLYEVQIDLGISSRDG